MTLKAIGHEAANRKAEKEATMNLIINPGSTLPHEEDAVGWTNTHDQAKRYAYEQFYKPMLEQGFQDIEVNDTGELFEGRWKFIFKHTVTGKEVELETHGIDDLKAYEKQYIFAPRIYWNGSSSSNPELDDFRADGFEPVMTYRQAEVSDLATPDRKNTPNAANPPSGTL